MPQVRKAPTAIKQRIKLYSMRLLEMAVTLISSLLHLKWEQLLFKFHKLHAFKLPQ